jgi:hypothetical protein
VPPLLDEEMVELQQAVEAEAVDPDASTTPKPRNSLEGMPLAPRGVRKRGPWIVIGGVEAPSPDTLSIEGEVHACFQQIQGQLGCPHLIQIYSDNPSQNTSRLTPPACLTSPS